MKALFSLFVLLPATLLGSPISDGIQVHAEVLAGLINLWVDKSGNEEKLAAVDRGDRTILVYFTNIGPNKVRLPTRGFRLERRTRAQDRDVVIVKWSESEKSSRKMVLPASDIGIVELDRGETALLTFDYPAEWPANRPIVLSFAVSEWASKKYQIDWYAGEVQVVP